MISADYLQAISAFVAVLGTLVGYSIQKTLDYKSRTRDAKRPSYEEFLVVCPKPFEVSGAASRYAFDETFYKEYTRLTLHAASTVLLSVYNYLATIDRFYESRDGKDSAQKTEEVYQTLTLAYQDVVVRMREDAFAMKPGTQRKPFPTQESFDFVSRKR